MSDFADDDLHFATDQRLSHLPPPQSDRWESRRHRVDDAFAEGPPMLYRSEAFAEDLVDNPFRSSPSA